MNAVQKSAAPVDFDVIIAGGGFYGCCLALFLRSVTDNILVLEADTALMTRASRVNQARVHTGFHYPRSFVTALRSRYLQSRFVADFPEAIDDHFTMLYGIARYRSKVSGSRFYKMYSDMDAPLEPASRAEYALFDSRYIEDIFRCDEVAFNWLRLREALAERLAKTAIKIRFETPARKIESENGRLIVETSDGQELAAKSVFNITYGNLNSLLQASGLKTLKLKHELAEVALVHRPADLSGYGVTIMDGPFFSIMPFPAQSIYSLTHVRYTPHYSWLDQQGPKTNYEYAAQYATQSRWRHMTMDAARFMPCLREMRYSESLFDVKTVLVKNERDDGRPILFHAHQDAPGLHSVLGSKIDNIYDLFEITRTVKPEWRAAHDTHLLGTA